MTHPELEATAETVATACRILGNLDLTHEALGHVSYRAPDSPTILIKGKGPNEVGLRYTTPEDILEVDFDAKPVSSVSGLQPPSESYIHLWMYRKNPSLRSVIHVHPEAAVLLTICGIEIQPIYGAFATGSRIAVAGVPVYPRSRTVADDTLGEEFADFMGDNTVAMMHGHGITVVGTSVQEATVRAIAFNQLARMTYQAHLLGTPKLIAEDEIERLRAPLETGRKRGSAGGAVSTLASWRYYETLAGHNGAHPQGR